MDKARILIIDDERNTREGLLETLQDDYDVYAAEDALKGLAYLQKHPVDIILTDLRMPGIDGLEFTRQVSSRENAPLIIMLTAYGSVQTAVEALKAGAYDYISKPVDLDGLEMMLQRGLEELRKRRVAAGAATSTAGEDSPSALGIIGQSKALADVMEQVRRVAAVKTTVLVTGESGTGKELVAHAIHDLSPRREKPFVAVHCASLSESLLESELFGHERGAFTGAVERAQGRFEVASGGTLFLDEIGEISLPTQVKLLRVLETQTFERVGGTQSLKVDVRVVAATNRDLHKMVQDGTFREDLYYRLNVVNICLPPLRERREDIPLLVDFYLRKYASENDKYVSSVNADAMEVLKAYDWPGNVRELRNAVERMVVFAQGKTLTVNDIPNDMRQALDRQFSPHAAADPVAPASLHATAPAGGVDEPVHDGAETSPQGALDVHENEKKLILRALAECGGNRSKAAEMLRISRRTLYRKLDEYGLN